MAPTRPTNPSSDARPVLPATPDMDPNEIVEEIARENLAETSNGNREYVPEEKPGGAERGGPDREKARERQPPHSDIRHGQETNPETRRESVEVKPSRP